MALRRMGMVLAALGCALLAVQPQVGISAAQHGLSIWLGTLIPAMFPYCFLAIALQRGGLGRALGRRLGGLMRMLGCPASGAGAIVCGWLGGNPAGARLTAICAAQDGMSPREALQLAWLASACSPAFVLGPLESALPGCGHALLASCWLGTLCGGLLVRPMRRGGAPSAPVVPAATHEHRSCALDAAHSMLVIGCWVVLMSVLAAYMYMAVLAIAPDAHPLPAVMAHALLEMAGGTIALAGLGGEAVLPLISFSITFGGLSIGMQALALLRPTGVRALPYLAGKAVQGVMAALICALLMRTGATAAFSPAHGAAAPVDSQAIPALIALVLGVIAARLNRRFIAYQNADAAGRQDGTA